MSYRRLAAYLLFPLSLSVSGCVVAAAGAGVGGAVYLTDRGAESIVSADGPTAQDAAEKAFADYEISRTDLIVQDDRERRQLKGRSADDRLDVTVTIEREKDGLSKVKITAATSAVTWDRDFAKQLLERIVEYTG